MINAKKAKQLRKIARQMATEPVGYKYIGNSKRFVVEPQEKVDPSTLAGDISPAAEVKAPKINYFPGTIMVNPNSYRGVYKQLKKAAAKF